MKETSRISAAARLPPPSPPSRIRTLATWLFGAAMAGTLVFVVLHFGDLEAFGQSLKEAQPGWLVAAFLLQAVTYACVARGWSAVLIKAGSPIPLRHLLPIAISKLFADQMIPIAGMGGNMLLIDRLVALGVPRGAAVAVLLVSLIGFYAAYAALALATLALLWMNGKATPLIAILVALFLSVAIAIPALALWLGRRGSHRLSPILERLTLVRSLLHVAGEAPITLIGDRRLIVRVALLNGLVFFADAATMTVCFRALGQPVSFEIAFIAVMAASMIVTLGPVPLGLGSFEAGSTAALSLLGVPMETALAATLLLRGFTLWLPLLPGLFMMRVVIRKRPASTGPRKPGSTG
ncbi:flippase-like domain-containing protein [Sphingomonas sp. So64.6b]|nr:flippase-like domain-containing protein [Sphingomonas sp. So64.6b]